LLKQADNPTLKSWLSQYCWTEVADKQHTSNPPNGLLT